MAKSDFTESWYFSGWGQSALDKDQLITNYLRFMFDRTTMMFEYDNLPDTIRKRDLEYLLQNFGYGCALMYEGKPYVLRGTIAGTNNEQYLPTRLIVTNAYLNLSRDLTIGVDGVWFRNDSTWRGLYPLHRKFAELLADCDISLRFATINSRLLNFVSASDDRTKVSAERILDDVWNGRKLGVVAEKPMIESFKTYPAGTTSNSYITQLIELRQYLYGSWFIEMGINANYNLKRETLTSTEIGINEETLTPLVDNMEEERSRALEEMNRLFGTDIRVRRSSSWKKVAEESALQVEAMKAEIEQTKEEGEDGNDSDADESKGTDQ